MSLFSQDQKWAPLAERMRPKRLSDIAGQSELLEKNKGLLSAFSQAPEETRSLPSLIFWGPPGTGKTTLARLLSEQSHGHFEKLSAIEAGVKDLRKVFSDASRRRETMGERTILFVDEIHRFSKSQQDSFLHALESGNIVLIGATTENPSFELNNALLSRCRVLVLKSLETSDVIELLTRALNDMGKGLGRLEIQARPEALEYLAQISAGDARVALNSLEAATYSKEVGSELSKEDVESSLKSQPLLYDKDGEFHYDLVSALHKSIRNSNPQAALYYMARMLEGGEDPKFIARRLVRAASEDIGLADPQALVQALAAKSAVEFVGLPECDNALAQAAVYLATAPKSNSVYKAVAAARELAREFPSEPVPLHLRNSPTKLMKELGFGEGYKYDHDYPDKVSDQEAMPEKIKNRVLYKPEGLGFEKEVLRRMEYFETLRKKQKK